VSHDNVERVRAIYDAWARGDFSSSDWADPRIEFVLADGPSTGTWIGVKEMAAAWRDVLRAWADFRAEAEGCRALDDTRVLVLTRNTGRGRGSGVDVTSISTKGANVFSLRDGKVTRIVAYWDRERILADLAAEN
jgi:ketosteroid isomerase-like protein